MGGLPTLAALAKQEGREAELELAHMVGDCLALLPPGPETLPVSALEVRDGH